MDSVLKQINEQQSILNADGKSAFIISQPLTDFYISPLRHSPHRPSGLQKSTSPPHISGPRSLQLQCSCCKL